MIVGDDSGGDDPPDWLRSLAAQRPRRADTAPDGVSLLRSLVVPPGVLPRDQALRGLLGTIDAVHGDGILPPLPIRWGTLPLGMVARYQVTEDLADAVSLTVDSGRPRWRLAVIHEVGHFLDHRGILPAESFASFAHPRLHEWRTVTLDSTCVRRLIAVLDAGAYLTRMEELWARSYAQWVAVRSRDAGLWTDIVESRGTNPTAPRFFRQWDEPEFAPIAATIDRLFRSLGWIV